MAIPAQATPDILSLLNLFTSKSGTTSGTQTQTTKSDISKEGMDALLRQILESDKGVASIVSGERKAGIYNSSVNQQLLGDFLSRAAGELAVKQAGTTTTSSSSQSQKTDPTLDPLKTAGIALGASLLGPSVSRGLTAAGIEGGIGGLGKSLADLIFGAQGGKLSVDTSGYQYNAESGAVLPDVLRGGGMATVPPADTTEEDLTIYPAPDYGDFGFLFGGTSGTSGD